MPFAEDQHPVGNLGPGGEHESFRISVRPWTPRRDFHHIDPGVSPHRVERIGELTGPVPDQEPEPRGAIAQIHQQVANLLYGPRPVWVCGDPEDVHVAGADLHDEQAVQALQRHCAVHVEEIGGEHRGCLNMQELPPGRVGAPLRCRRDLQRPEDPADGGGGDLDAEDEEFAVDAPVPPGRVLPG